MDTNSENPWVNERLAALEPRWSPNAARARESLDARLNGRARSWTWMAAATTAAVCIVTLALPGTRAVAQQLWDRFVLNRVDIVRVDLSRLPVNTFVRLTGEDIVPDINEAERKAGFRPYLPPFGVLSAQPELKVSGRTHIEQVIRTHDLETALDKVGASELRLAPEWDNAKLHIDAGPIVSADYPDARIEQSRPFEFSMPGGFPLDRFAEAAFRSVGISAWESHALGQRFASHPSWLWDIPAEKAVNIQDVMLRNGPALVVEDFDGKTTTVLRATVDRIYYVSSGTRELSLQIAESLP